MKTLITSVLLAALCVLYYWFVPDRYERVEFELVEGNQYVPLGQNGAYVLVGATQDRPGEVRNADGSVVGYVPMVSYSILHDPFNSVSFNGTLPATLVVQVERR